MNTGKKKPTELDDSERISVWAAILALAVLQAVYLWLNYNAAGRPVDGLFAAAVYVFFFGLLYFVISGILRRVLKSKPAPTSS
jgi:polyferredoxin